MTTIATFTANKGEFVFNAVAFGNGILKAGMANKTQVRALVSELGQLYKPQTVTVELASGKLWINYVTANGDGYSFVVGSRGKTTKPTLLF